MLTITIKENMKTKSQPTRQEAQDLILIAHKFQDSTVPGTMDVREILLALSESGLTLSYPNNGDNVVAHFALQLLEDPSLENYDPSIEVLI
jgi:hypothetical protein